MKNPGHTSLSAAYQEMLVSPNLILAGGTVTDATLAINPRSSIWPQRITAAGTPGFLSLVNIATGTYDVITDNVLDVSTLRALVLQGGATQRIGAGLFNDKLSPHGGSGGLAASGGVSDGCQVDVVQIEAAGTITVNDHYVPSGARFMLFALTAGGVQGHLSVANVVPGNPGSFDIVSSNAGDTSVIQYAIIDPAIMQTNQLIGCRDGSVAKSLQVLRGTLVAGTLAFPGTIPVTANKSGIFAQRVTPGGALGHLTVTVVTAGDPGSITVASSNAGDTSVVDVFRWANTSYGQAF